MKVIDIMSKKVVMVSPEAPLRQLWKKIFTSHINAVPVVDKNKMLLGIISKEDILKMLYPNYEDLIEDFFSVTDFEEMEKRIAGLGSTRAKEVMCKRVVFTREDTPIMRALSRMIARRLNQLPVLSRDDERVVGMVTKGDIFKALFINQLKGKLFKNVKKVTKKS